MSNDDKRYLLFIKLMIVILFGSGLLIGLIIGLNKTSEEYSSYSDNFISAINSPLFIKNQTLASMTDDMDIYLLAYEIIKCESNWNSKAQNRGSSAYGFGQFINGTWDYVQKKWNIELDRNNPDDQMYAMVRLLEEEGTKHWETSSYCWNK